MESIFSIITNLVIFVPIVVIFAILPYLTRKDVMFGITIPSSEWGNDDFKKMRKNYLVLSVILGVVLMIGSVISSVMLMEELMVVTMQILLWSALLIYFLLYIYFWTKTKKYKENAKWHTNAKNIAVADTDTNNKQRNFSSLWFIAYVVIIFITFLGALRLYDLAPNMIATRYDMQGNPIVYQPKSMNIVYQLVGMQIFIAALFFVINITIKRAKKTIDASDAKLSSKRNDMMKYRWSVFLFITGLLMLLIFAQILGAMFVDMPIWISMVMPMAAVLVILIYAIVLTIKTGQSGSRIKLSDGKSQTGEITRDDDSLWKLGMFYYNKDDPAVFVEKRFGAGWTTNWARWQSWLFILAVLGIVAASIILSK